MIESTQKEIDNLIGVTEVHAPFYKVSALYLKEVGDFAGYYREALRYLGVEDINKLTADEKYSQALLVGFAALLGENVYNFGELVDLCLSLNNRVSALSPHSEGAEKYRREVADRCSGCLQQW